MRPSWPIVLAVVALLVSATACGGRRLKAPPTAAATVTVIVAPPVTGVVSPSTTSALTQAPVASETGGAPTTSENATQPLPSSPEASTPPSSTTPAAPTTTQAATGATTSAQPSTAARMLVTRGFGATSMLDRPVASGQSVIAALQTVAKITTTYGGGFVQSIGGVSGSLSSERDWFFFVDGIEADSGSAGFELRPGQTAWWDQRLWKQRMSSPAVVGVWPEPFLHGYTSNPGGVAADPPLNATLRSSGAPVLAAGTRSSYQVLVGPDASLRKRSKPWSNAESDPAGAGLTAWFAKDGSIQVWNASAQRSVPVPTATAVIAAVLTGTEASDGVTFAVAGKTAAAATAAATALARAPGLVAGSYAVCLDASDHVVCRGGRGVSP